MHEDLLAPLRHRAGVGVRRRGVRARAPQGPGGVGRGVPHPAGAGQASRPGRARLDHAPGVASEGAPLVRRAVRMATGDQARVGRSALRPPARAFRALHRSCRAPRAPPLSAARPRRDAPPPPGSEPAQSVHRETGARRLRPGDHRQRVRPPSARRRARAPHRSRDRRLLWRRTEVRADAEGQGAPRALWARGPSGSPLSGTAHPPKEPVLPRRGLRRDPTRRARTGGTRLGRRWPAPRRADRARPKARPRGRRDLHGLRARGREGSYAQSGRRFRLSFLARGLPAGAAGGDVVWQAGRRLPRGLARRDGGRRAVGIPRRQERPERVRRARARPAARP